MKKVPVFLILGVLLLSSSCRKALPVGKGTSLLSSASSEEFISSSAQSEISLKESVSSKTTEGNTLAKDQNKNAAPADNQIDINKADETPPVIHAITEENKWMIKLANFENTIEDGYVVETAVITGSYRLDKRIIEDTKKMIAAAKADGVTLTVDSAYRTIEYQRQLIERIVNEQVAKGKTREEGYAIAYLDTAKPGQSDHNLGLAIDFAENKGNNYTAAFKNTASAKWLLANSYKYGFILRYPEGKFEITKIVFEPWHYRYVGVFAREIYESGLTLEEWLKVRNELSN